MSGLIRIWHGMESGRELLQGLGALASEFSPLESLDRTTWFDALSSKRRFAWLCEIDSLIRALLRSATGRRDMFAGISELDDFEIWAGDGHWQKAAIHDPKSPKGESLPTGHIFYLDLRSHCLRHLTVCDDVAVVKEHDMHAIKRLKASHLRIDTPKGKKTIVVYDRAALDGTFWYRAKLSDGVYLISRSKSNLRSVFEVALSWNREDPRNAGVIADELISISQVTWRRVTVPHVTKKDEVMELITTEMNLPPGIIAALYKRRWEIERVFKELKGSFNQERSWATRPTGKHTQGRFIALAHNLGLLAEAALKTAGIKDEAEEARRDERTWQYIQRIGLHHQPELQPTLESKSAPPPDEVPPDEGILAATPRAIPDVDSDPALASSAVPRLSASRKRAAQKKINGLAGLDHWKRCRPKIPSASLLGQAITLVSSHITCLSVKLIRWLASRLFDLRPLSDHLSHLKSLYAEI
jgi:hypothetical protein